MIQVRHADERGAADFGWLDSKHTFSFGQFYDPDHMGFGPLRVINEDRVAPGKGFDTHGHQDMEIISYVLDGALEHKDSLGTGSVIRAGDVQRMTAGSGIRHSEFNHSDTDPVHFLQIWILPEREGLEPGYEQRSFSSEDRSGGLRLLASRNGEAGSLTVHQDVRLYGSLLRTAEKLVHPVQSDRRVWIQVVRGALTVNGKSVGSGDGVALADEHEVHLVARSDSEILLFDMG